MYHLLFLLSPVLIFLIFVIGTLGNVATINDHIAFVDIMIIIIRVYTVIFMLASSYIFFRLRRLKLTSNWDVFITNGYPIASSTFFGWMFLLPFMRQTVGMWDIDFLNMMVTLILGYAAFFFLVGMYELIALFMPSQKAQS